MRAQVLPMNTGVEGGETAIKLARYDLLCCIVYQIPCKTICISAHTQALAWCNVMIHIGAHTYQRCVIS